MARGGSGSARQRRSRKAGNSGAVAQRDDPFAEGNRRASKAGHLTQCQHAAPQMDETGGATGGGGACATMNERTILWVDPFCVLRFGMSFDPAKLRPKKAAEKPLSFQPNLPFCS